MIDLTIICNVMLYMDKGFFYIGLVLVREP